MPGEAPGPTPEEIEAVVQSNAVPEGVDEGRVKNSELTVAMAEKELEAHNQAQERADELKANPRMVKKDGELVARARRQVDKIIQKGEVAAEETGQDFAKDMLIEKVEKEKGYIKNKDEALEMAHAEKPERDMAANLKAIGSEGLAAGRLEAAAHHADKISEKYNDSVKNALTSIEPVLQGTQLYARLREPNLEGYKTVIQAVAGKDTEPVFEQDKGRGKHRVHESIYASTSNPNVVMVERRNARTGEVISVHTVNTGTESLVENKGVKIPTKKLRQAISEARDFDKDTEIDTKGPKLAYSGGVGEYAMLQTRRLPLDSDNAHEAVLDYRRRLKAQQKAVPFWQRFFNF